MTSPDIKELKNIAESVRRWACSYAHKKSYNGNRYIDHKSLTGMCAIASIKTVSFLESKGITDYQIAFASLPSDICHVFVLVEKYRIDPTVSQFTNKNSTVELHDKKKSKWYHNESITFSNIPEFVQYLKDVGWQKEQMPNVDEILSI